MKHIRTAREQVALLAPWRTAAESSLTKVYHLTRSPDFSPDPNHTPVEGLHWSHDPADNPKGLYVSTTPNYWLSWGNRPYVAEYEVPSDLLGQLSSTRNQPEHFIPPEHFDKLNLKRVLPTPGLLRENGTSSGGFSDPEHAMGQDFETREKFQTRRAPNGMTLPEDREKQKQLWNKNYGEGPYIHQTDARNMTNQHRRNYENWFNKYWNQSWAGDDS